MGTDPKDAFNALMAESRNTVIFTGAGISTESGIPDFRSPGGVWTQNKPIPFQDFMMSKEARLETWRRKFNVEKTMRDASPNVGHLAIAQMVARGQVEKIITQNIDGLHQASGVPESKIIELHGNTTYARCLSCHIRHELDPIRVAFQRTRRFRFAKLAVVLSKRRLYLLASPCLSAKCWRLKEMLFRATSSLPSDHLWWCFQRLRCSPWQRKMVQNW